MKLITNQQFDLERDLYGTKDTVVDSCVFDGEDKDAESALKECRNIVVKNSTFALRYPVWHAQKYEVNKCEFKETARAPFWYCVNGKIVDSKIYSVKALRECNDVEILNSHIESTEFGWRNKEIKIKNTEIVGEYVLFESKNIEIDNFKLKGKYSFQYVEDAKISNSELDTKDAFWHSKNVTVEDTLIKGEYLGWYSDGLTLINCKIIGTQPLCYCKNLKLIDCEMVDCDLSFEYSEVDASINGYIESIKNPKSGKIVVDNVGSIILDGSIIESRAEIIEKKYDNRHD